jgi:hypothetical protein
VLMAVLVRRLKEGVTYEQFREAWAPEHGFGTEVRVLNALNVEDPREIVSVGLMPGATRDELPAFLERVAASEAARHEPIDEVIDGFVLRGIYEVVGDEGLS